jgi:hypothetical protein
VVEVSCEFDVAREEGDVLGGRHYCIVHSMNSMNYSWGSFRRVGLVLSAFTCLPYLIYLFYLYPCLLYLIYLFYLYPCLLYLIYLF